MLHSQVITCKFMNNLWAEQQTLLTECGKLAITQAIVIHVHPLSLGFKRTLGSSLVPNQARINSAKTIGDINPFSWAQKCASARILAGQSELSSCTIVQKSWKLREKQTI